jgi:hypothetical protein
LLTTATFKPCLRLELCDQIDHLEVWLGLGEHEGSELSPGERSILVEDHSTQVLIERELPLFVCIEGQVVPIFHLGQVQIEVRRRPLPAFMCPAVGEQHATDVHEQAGDSGRRLHRPFSRLKRGHSSRLHVRQVVCGRARAAPTREKIPEYRAPTSGQIMVLLNSYASPTELASLSGVSNQLDQDFGEVLG